MITNFNWVEHYDLKYLLLIKCDGHHIILIFTLERTKSYTLEHSFSWMRKNMLLDPHNDPKAWEEYFKNIVKLHYKTENYCDIPDTHGGDFGIECYTLNGHVFQCYRPEQYSDVDKLYTAQKNKISKDIKKFTEDNVDDFKKLFGVLKISRWILATPYNKSAKLAQFCTKKTLEVRGMNIPYIDDDFQILVKTEHDYIQEASILRRDKFQLSFDFDSITDEKAKDFIDGNLAFLEKLNLKIPKINANSGQHDHYKSYMVQKYLEYQNLLDVLKRDWVDIYQVVYKSIKGREENLVGMFMISPDAIPSKIIKDEIQGLKDEISEEIPSFKQSDLDKITWGVISDWLIRCPLDF
ncbi:hypothetical protein [Huaxiibacter chinensis]